MRNLYIALSSFMISVSFTSFAQQKDQRGGNCEQTKSQHEYFCTKKGDPAKDDIMTTANIACNNAKRNMAPPDRQLQKIVSGAGWCGVMICSKFMCIEGVPMTNEVIFSLKNICLFSFISISERKSSLLNQLAISFMYAPGKPLSAGILQKVSVTTRGFLIKLYAFSALSIDIA